MGLRFILVFSNYCPMSDSLYGTANLACIPMRAAPSHRSELVNQLLYNETYRVLERQEEWLQIQCRHDGYEGWIAANQFHDCSKTTWAAAWETVLPQAVQRLEQKYFYLGTPYSPSAPILSQQTALEQACTAAQALLWTPYLWGGRTCAGIDCSGLVQVAYRVGGWLLPRDASQQIACGEAVPWGAQQRGDLAFFHNAKGAIVHVGMLLTPWQILHASGWVRVDRLDEAGIWHKGQQTHELTALRRLTPPTRVTGWHFA